MRRRATVLSLAAALAVPAAVVSAKDPTYVGSVHVVPGIVFLDADRDFRLNPGEKGIAGVMVSNGREVVATDANGACALPEMGWPWATGAFE